MRIKLEDNSRSMFTEMDTKKEEILFQVGLKWQEVVKKIITVQEEVDTGRMRASMSFITNKRKSPNTLVANSKMKDFLEGSSGDTDTLIVGSNVPYAFKNEMHNRKGAFLKPSLLNYESEYKAIAEDILKK